MTLVGSCIDHHRADTVDAIAAPHPNPVASVLIVNHNGGADLSACLASLSCTAHDAYEVIVVDNASTDGSADQAEVAFPDVRWARSPENLGFGGANNLAASQAHGEILVFLNPDTHVTPGWLDALVQVLQNDPRAGLATSRILLKDHPDRVNAAGNVMHITGLTLCRGMGADRDAFDTPEEVDAVSGAAFAIRRSLFDALGGFDAAFFLYMEDTDLSWRARLAGYTCRYVPESIVYHDYVLRFGPRKTYYQERNRWMMLLKTLRWGTLVVMVPTLLVGEIVTWGFVLLKDRRHFTNKLEAYGWVVAHWGEIMAKRRATQATRTIRDRELLQRTTHRLPLEQVERGGVRHLVQAVLGPLFWVLRLSTLVLTGW